MKKRITFIGTLILIFSVFLSNIYIFAAPKVKENNSTKNDTSINIISTIKYDLNGDGNLENISISNEKNNYFIIFNKLKYKFSTSKIEVRNVSVIDIKTNDLNKEILIETIKDDKSEFIILEYNGKQFYEIARLNKMPVILGNGTVIIEEDMGFWIKKDKYVLTDKTGKIKLKQLPQELYYVGAKARVKKGFELFSNREDSKELATITLSEGEIIDIVMCDTSNWFKKSNQKNNKIYDWYLIKTSSNLTGWARLKDFEQNIEFIK
ncbi:hypothetical protein ACAG39_07940 [Caldicellulosiruptoraceae bacterium PP1]